MQELTTQKHTGEQEIGQAMSQNDICRQLRKSQQKLQQQDHRKRILSGKRRQDKQQLFADKEQNLTQKLCDRLFGAKQHQAVLSTKN